MRVTVISLVVMFLSATTVRAGTPQDPPREAAPGPQSETTTPDEISIQPEDRPFKGVLKNLLNDARSLASMGSATRLLVGGTASIAAHSADDRVKRWVANSGFPSYTKFGNELGSAWIEGAAALSTYGAGRLWHRPLVAHVGSDLIRAQTLNSVLILGVKFTSDRTRPNGERFSLPSYHSGATFASAAVLHRHFGWKTGLPAYGTAAFVGWTRIRDQAHWVSDVVLGATIGTITGETIARGHRAGRWQLTPAASTQGVAIYLVRN